MGISFSGLSQIDSTSKNSLPVVSVMAEYSRQHISDLTSAAPRFIINENKIKQLGSVDVGEAMKYVPGVQMRDYGGIGGIKTISYRSLGASHTAVTLDNYLMVNAQTGVINLSAFETFGMRSIEFNSGQPQNSQATATSYIPASLISIHTPLMSSDTSFGTKLYQNLTSINAYESGLLLNTPIKKRGFIGFQGFSRYGSGEYNYIYSLTGSDEVQRRTNARLFGVKGRLIGGYRWKTSKLSTNVIYNKQDQLLPGAVILYNPSHDQELQNEDLRADIDFFKFWNKWTLKSHAFATRNYTRYHDPSFLNMEGFITSEYNQFQQGGGAIAHFKPFNDERKLFFGSDLITAQLQSSEFENEPDRICINSVLGAAWWFGRLKIEGHINHQYIYDNARSGDSIQNVTYNQFSPYLSAAVIPFKEKGIQLRTFYKRVFRMPTFNDLYYNFIGNTNLKPEDAHLFNFGFTYGNQAKYDMVNFEMNIDGFYNYVKNKIVAVPTKDLFNLEYAKYWYY